jgi:hypothetical protein
VLTGLHLFRQLIHEISILGADRGLELLLQLAAFFLHIAELL